MTCINFDSENLVVDRISFNIQGLTSKTGIKRIARRLSSHFTPLVIINNEFGIGYSGLRNKYHVSLRQYTKNNWVGLRLFSLVKMRFIFINFSKLKNLIGVFLS